MKKRALFNVGSIIVVVLAMLIAISITTFAANNMSAVVTSSGKVAQGQSITFSVKINNGKGVQGILVIPTYDKSVFELVGGEWVISGGLMQDFSVANGDGVIAFSPAKDINTTVLTFKLKAKSDAPLGNQTVSAEIVVTDGNGNNNLTVTSSTVQIQCNHNYSTNDLTYLKSEASCSSPALYYKICTICGEHNTETFPYGEKLDHTPGAAATETTAQKCTVCGQTLVPALGHTHNYSSEISSNENEHWYACTSCGAKKSAGKHVFDSNCDADCSECGYERTVTHNFGTELFYDGNNHWQECDVCGEKASETSHNWDNGVLTQEATEGYSGIKTYCCQSCNAEKIELTPALGSTNEGNGNQDIGNGNQNIDNSNEGIDSNNNSNVAMMVVAIVEGVIIVALVVVIITSKKKLPTVNKEENSDESIVKIESNDTETES